MLLLVVGLLCGVTGWREDKDTPSYRDVVTTQGTVRGYMYSSGYSYLGIPYARPHERFKAPEPSQRWDGIFEAIYLVRCLGTDDCLALNVYVPERGTSLPVLVYVHAGGFQYGWGPLHSPSTLLRKGIVVVTFNHRLGAGGFLCLGVPQATGNAGIKDQVAALYWVQRNIAKFGGNPHDVTVYGTESGAASIQVLLLSGMTEGLLHKVILEVGSVLSPSSMTYNPLGTALEAARKLGYGDDENPIKLLKFYQKLKDKELSAITEIFLPCVENSSYYAHTLLEEDPRHLLMQGKFQKVPTLIAYTNSVNTIHSDALNTFLENFDDLLPNNLQFENNTIKHRVAELAKEFYFGQDNTNLGEKYAKYAHDVFTEYPVVKSALLHALKSPHPVFLLRFDNSVNNNEVTRQRRFKTIFDYIYPRKNIIFDERMTDVLLTLWSNFIKLGDPTPLTTELIPIIWQPVVPNKIERSIDINSLRELVISGRTINMATTSSPYLSFWESIYKRFYKSHISSND